MEFIRSFRYNDGRWQAMIGGVDEDFVAFALNQGFELMAEFIDPVTGYEVGTEHLMASCDGTYTIAPPSDPEMVNAGDVAGWGGDLLTFYADWRQREETYASAYDFTIEHLAVPGVETSFGFADLIEDADAFNLARIVEAGTNIASATASYYSSNGSSNARFSDFYQERFLNLETAGELAYQILVGSMNPVVVAARRAFTWNVITPEAVPEENFHGMCIGFAEILEDRAENER